jgi:hypothetical protein
VTIISGSFSGKLGGTSNDCAGLVGSNPVTGTITIKWKTVEKLVSSSSVVTPGQLAGNLFTAPWGGAYGQFDLGGSGAAVTGSFAGTDGGASSTTTAVTGEDVTNILGQCATIKGLKTIHIAIGQLNLA